MSEVKLIPTYDQIKETARAQAREVLSSSNVYLNMPLEEQKSIYLSVVDDNIRKQEKKHGISRSFATDSGADMGYKGYDPGFKGDTQSFNELVDSVDFPKFVSDLLKAVFNANLDVMKKQTDSYIKLMKEATKSSADFIKKVKDEESFARLAESKGDKYNVVTGPDGGLSLTNPQGDEVDKEDAEVKKDILEAKINMAKEHRAALREVLLMGVTRLVVNKGVIEAGVDFSVTATRKSDSHHKDENINTVNADFEYGGGLGSLFGGPSGSMSITNTNIQVNTSNKQTDDVLQAKLHGKVNIEFKTDYFKLDNFANMYADGGVAALKPATPAGTPAPALPAR